MKERQIKDLTERKTPESRGQEQLKTTLHE